MDVILVTASHSNDVHGTFNGKRTGCGINLLKPENATRYRRGSSMTDLGELTCEKCKAKIAKEMIKSDQKEMKVLLKEEKLRAKKGIEDEGIVPLGNTTARITRQQEAAPVRPAPVRNTAPEPEPEYVQNTEPAYIPEPAPGAPALDAELAKFAVNPHPQEEAAPEPVHTPSPAPQDDFMAQFAINKPQEEAPAENTEDDFLAQFAINNTPEPAQTAPAAPPVIDDISAALAAMQQNPAITPQQAQPVEMPGRYDNDPNVIDVDNSAVTEAPSAQNVSEWDIIANQLFGGAPGAGSNEMAGLSAAEPVAQPTAPVMAQPVQEAPVIDDISAAINAMNTPLQAAPAAPAPVYAEPAVQPTAPVMAQPVQEAPVIDDISAAINAMNTPLQAAPAAPAPVYAEPAVQPTAPTMAQPVQEAPVIDDISAAINAMNTPVQPAPAAPAPVYAEPAVQPTAPTMAQPVQEAPVIDDISAAISAMNTPAQPVSAPAPAPAVSEPAVQPTAPTMAQPVQEAPVIDDISAAINAMNTPAQPVSAPAPAPAISEPAVQPTAPTMAQPVQEAPVIDDISAAINAMNTPAQPVSAPAPTPTVAQPAAQPTAPVTDALFDAIDSFVQPVQPTAPVQPKQTAAPQQAAQPAAGMPGVGQVISVPQITGYDDRNQPEYTYIKMRIQGFDTKGQPVLVPLPGQDIPIPSAPDQFTPAGVLDKNVRLKDALAAAMEAPVSSRDMTPGQRIAAANAAKGDPVSANVSKIATNPHAKATSQAFINAISVSKEYSNQSLTDTQGLQQRTAVLGSVEDVLSQFGDNSLKEKKLAEQKVQEVAPVAVNEYKGPVRSYSTRSSAPKPSPAQRSSMPDRPLTKSELKQMKKQEKIDAKFQKEMAKRGR